MKEIKCKHELFVGSYFIDYHSDYNDVGFGIYDVCNMINSSSMKKRSSRRRVVNGIDTMDFNKTHHWSKNQKIILFKKKDDYIDLGFEYVRFE